MNEGHDTHAATASRLILSTGGDLSTSFSTEVYDFIVNTPDYGSNNQRAVLALCANAYAALTEGTTRRDAAFLWHCAFPIALVYGVYYLFFHSDLALYISVACIAVLILLNMLLISTSFNIALGHNDSGQIRQIVLGRLERLLRRQFLPAIGVLMWMVLLCQYSLISLSSNHLGISEVAGSWDAAYVTLNNVFHGLLDGIPNLFALNVGPKVEKLPKVTAVLFTCFRLGYDYCIGLAAFRLLQRHRLVSVVGTIPREVEVGTVLKWMSDMAAKGDWNRVCFDEFVFTCICVDYIEGRFALVREMASRFKNIKVEENVRSYSSTRPTENCYSRKPAPRTGAQGTRINKQDTGDSLRIQMVLKAREAYSNIILAYLFRHIQILLKRFPDI